MILPLKISHLTKRFDKLVAVDDVSFEIKPGEVFGLLGPNGAGKTTIISSIVTLLSPSSGTIEVYGTDVGKNPRRAKTHIGFVPQELIHHGFFSVEEILKYHATYFGIKIDQGHLQRSSFSMNQQRGSISSFAPLYGTLFKS
jgi:ABC-2 type transport system ATP-binding protein